MHCFSDEYLADELLLELGYPIDKRGHTAASRRLESESLNIITFSMNKWLFYEKIKPFQNLCLSTIWVPLESDVNYFDAKAAHFVQKNEEIRTIRLGFPGGRYKTRKAKFEYNLTFCVH